MSGRKIRVPAPAERRLHAVADVRPASPPIGASAADLASTYHSAVGDMLAAERRHKEAVAALNEAIDAREATRLPSLRKSARATESALWAALDAATAAHARYWSNRRQWAEPEVHNAARVLRRYDAIARAAGDRYTVRPSLRVIEDMPSEVAPGIVNDCDDVPPDAPDSELYFGARGYWKGSGDC